MKIGFIGAGNMGGALARAAAKSADATILLCDKDNEKAAKLAAEIGATAVPLSVIGTADVIFLGVKPQNLAETVAEFLPELTGHPLFVSMAAGVPLGKLESLLGDCSIIRIMPNTPVAVGGGVIAFAANGKVTEAEKNTFLQILSAAGTLKELAEGKIDAECAVAGCGPAFVAMFVEALADGGVLCGLSREDAMLFARETVAGTAALLRESGMHPGELKDKVCSPGGSTIEGVKALENGNLRATVMDAVKKAFDRTVELGK